MTAHVIISGFVQGVGFRHFVREKARELGLFGFVRNLPDNRVEALFQGPKEVVLRMIAICERGPFLSEVKDVQVSWENTKIIYSSFDITP